ncbi:MAG: hypothetical protein COT16_03195 [Elusimicrobia bacterium CG08_land_8_20_14_0_20_44_26]|nr:MAG: hypothetical protein COT16_03195 [Elusimicrobia bacterium CG08_land_8_20_14_0_20_44_26]
MFIEEYKRHKKDQARAFAKMRSAAQVVHPFVVLALSCAAALAVFTAVKAGKGKKMDVSRPLLVVNLFNVGGGNAMLVETPSRKTILIDSGPAVPKNSDESSQFSLAEGRIVWKDIIKPYLTRTNIKEITSLVLTSPESGYCGGASEILSDNFPVGEVVASNTYFPGPRFRDFRNVKEAAEKRGILKKVSKGDVIFKGGGVSMQVLGPLIDYAGFEDFSKNASLVLRIVYGDTALIYCSAAGLSELNHIASYEGLASDVLVVADHCSGASFSISFIEEAEPKICLISVGRGNKEEYPDSKALMFFDAMRIKHYRTDLNGTLTVSSDGNVVAVKKEY